MKHIISTTIAAALFLGFLAVAQDAPKGRVNKRQENQGDRIKAGVNDGSLTEKEAKRLKAREGAVKAKEARDRADGKGFTNKEKAAIERQQDRISKDIYKQRNDKQVQK